MAESLVRIRRAIKGLREMGYSVEMIAGDMPFLKSGYIWYSFRGYFEELGGQKGCWISYQINGVRPLADMVRSKRFTPTPLTDKETDIQAISSEYDLDAHVKALEALFEERLTKRSVARVVCDGRAHINADYEKAGNLLERIGERLFWATNEKDTAT